MSLRRFHNFRSSHWRDRQTISHGFVWSLYWRYQVELGRLCTRTADCGWRIVKHRFRRPRFDSGTPPLTMESAVFRSGGSRRRGIRRIYQGVNCAYNLTTQPTWSPGGGNFEINIINHWIFSKSRMHIFNFISAFYLMLTRALPHWSFFIWIRHMQCHI